MSPTARFSRKVLRRQQRKEKKKKTRSLDFDLGSDLEMNKDRALFDTFVFTTLTILGWGLGRGF